MVVGEQIPTFSLFGENGLLPDILHCERIVDRAAGHEWQIYPHRHAHLHQFFFVQTSGAVLRVDGHETIMKPMTIVNIPQWTVHAFDFPEDTQGHVLSIPVTEFPEVFSDERTMVPGMSQWAVTNATNELVDLFEALYREFIRPSAQRQLILRSIAGMIASRVSQNLEQGTERDQIGVGQQVMQRFENLVRENFRNRVTIGHYADQLAITPTHLNRIVRTHSGHSTRAYIEICTFNEACRQIAYTRMTIAEIGFQLGYDDPAYFSRAFKRATGLSPGQYRKRVR